MADEETEFDFRMPGGIGHLVDTALEEASDGEDEVASTLAFPKQLKKPESREVPTMLIDGQQASIDRAVAASFITEPSPLPPPPAPVVTDDLVLPAPAPQAQQPPRVVVGRPEQAPVAPLALDIEAIAARPPRAPTWTPVQAPLPQTTGLPRTFWIAVAVLTLAMLVYSFVRWS